MGQRDLSQLFHGYGTSVTILSGTSVTTVSGTSVTIAVEQVGQWGTWDYIGGLGDR